MKSTRSVGACAALIALWLVSGGPLAGAGNASGQIEAGDLSRWEDRSTWAIPNRMTSLTEVGMGLIVDGPSGAMRLAFYVNQPTRGRAAVPTEIGVRVASNPRMNPNLLRRATLTFNATIPEQEGLQLDLSSVMTVDNPAPGAAITSGIAAMTADDFKKLAAADTISGNILGAPVVYREDQILAIKAFHDKLFPPKR